jgi:hypothetical protein
MARVNQFILLLFILQPGNNIYGQATKNTQVYFQVICGAGGYTSKEIASFRSSYCKLEDSSDLRAKLFYGSALEQILSAIILQHYYSEAQLKLSKNESDKIKQISKSKAKFSLCFTCTFQQEGTLKQLFNSQKYSTSLGILKEYLLNKI